MAGLYTAGADGVAVVPGGVAEAAETGTLEVGDAVVVPVWEAPPPGVLPPWQPLRSKATESATAADRARIKGRDTNEWRGMARLPNSCFGDVSASLGGKNNRDPARTSFLWITRRSRARSLHSDASPIASELDARVVLKRRGVLHGRP